MPTMRSSIIHRLISGSRAVGKDRRAAAAVELALAMPALCLFIFGIIEVGYALWVQNALDYSVASAARCASLNSGACSPALTTYAASQSGATVTASAFTYNCRAGDLCANSGTVTCGCQVTASFPLSLDIPWTNVSVTLTSEACYLPPPSKTCPNI